MFSQLFAILLTIVPLFNQNQVFASPVLLWSNANLPQSAVPLSTLSTVNLLSNSICKLPNEKIQLRLFAVNDLTNRDIQRGPQSQHPILLNAKKEQSQFRYFPNAADDAYKTFSLIPQSNNMHCSHIHFQVTSSNIYDTLHDALNAMQASIDSIGANTNTAVVMVLLSGPDSNQNSGYSRRQIESQVNVLVSESESCMFYAEQFYWGSVDKKDPPVKKYELDLDRSSCLPNGTNGTNGTSDSTVLELFWINGTTNLDTVRMSLIVNITGRYWYLEKVIVNESEYRYFAYGMHSKMDTPPQYSYVCTSATFIKYNSSTKYGTYDFNDRFVITNLQFQPFFGNGSHFGPPNYCTSFFTSGIWMGITSSLLCFGILLFGVHRLMSIRSNDRFDDPKGKPLIIKAQE